MHSRRSPNSRCNKTRRHSQFPSPLGRATLQGTLRRRPRRLPRSFAQNPLLFPELNAPGEATYPGYGYGGVPASQATASPSAYGTIPILLRGVLATQVLPESSSLNPVPETELPKPCIGDDRSGFLNPQPKHHPDHSKQQNDRKLHTSTTKTAKTTTTRSRPRMPRRPPRNSRRPSRDPIGMLSPNYRRLWIRLFGRAFPAEGRKHKLCTAPQPEPRPKNFCLPRASHAQFSLL